eukprot:2035142-Rhodomonas_salina.1
MTNGSNGSNGSSLTATLTAKATGSANGSANGNGSNGNSAKATVERAAQEKAAAAVPGNLYFGFTQDVIRLLHKVRRDLAHSGTCPPTGTCRSRYCDVTEADLSVGGLWGGGAAGREGGEGGGGRDEGREGPGGGGCEHWATQDPDSGGCECWAAPEPDSGLSLSLSLYGWRAGKSRGIRCNGAERGGVPADRKDMHDRGGAMPAIALRHSRYRPTPLPLLPYATPAITLRTYASTMLYPLSPYVSTPAIALRLHNVTCGPDMGHVRLAGGVGGSERRVERPQTGLLLA